MFIICRSPKGGVGTSVVAAAIAVQSAHAGADTLLIDLAGDQPDLLGVRPPEFGVTDWLGGTDVPLDGLAALELDVAPRLRLLARGAAPTVDRLDVLGGVCAAARRTVVVDAGVCADAHWAAGQAEEIVVLRACYLAVRRAGSVPSSTRLVVIEEPGRALRAADVAAALGVPVWRRLLLDPAVARSVDAGLLGARLPRSLRSLDLTA
ncbi:MAG: hypothetical protein AAGA90_12590 [Actinomycetota bacterium]